MSDQSEEVKMGSTIWQSQLTEPPRVSLEFFQFHAEKKARSLKNERGMFYVLVAIILVVWGISVFKHGLVINGPMDLVFRIFELLFSLALVCMVLHIRKHVRIASLVTDAGVIGGLAVYRSELERLLQISRREWHVLFYVAPSYFTLLIGGLIFDQRPGKVWRYGLTIATGALGAGFAFWVGRKKTRCLQRELDAVASLK